LIHRLWDTNQELLNYPYDKELQSITGPFGILQRVSRSAEAWFWFQNAASWRLLAPRCC